MLKQSQQFVEGEVRLELYKGNITITGRKSDYSLYDEDIASMEEDSGNYSPEDAKGFIKLNALPFRIYHSTRKNQIDKKKNHNLLEFLKYAAIFVCILLAIQ